jgi:hypothetical protein
MDVAAATVGVTLEPLSSRSSSVWMSKFAIVFATGDGCSDRRRDEAEAEDECGL